MFVVALKRAGFAVSWSRTASWEIPTVSIELLPSNDRGIFTELSRYLATIGRYTYRYTD
jgi:hypothetical protein